MEEFLSKIINLLRCHVYDSDTKVRIRKIEEECDSYHVADNPDKYFIYSVRKNPDYLLFLSQDNDCSYMKKTCQKIRNVKNLLDCELGSNIVGCILEGEINNRSLAVFKYGVPLCERKIRLLIFKKLITDEILEWLRNVTRSSMRPVTDSFLYKYYNQPLEFMKNNDLISLNIRNDAESAQDRIYKKEFLPVTVIMHNDFWKNNFVFGCDERRVLYKPFFWKRFRIIDWAGSTIEGYPVYDLVRFLFSFKINNNKSIKEFIKFSEILSCDIRDLRIYLLAALGSIGRNRGFFPLDRYNELVERSYYYINEKIPPL